MDAPCGPVLAAQYLRMSTERQDYSLTYQQTALSAYATERRYKIIQSYIDEGISGLDISGRVGLKRLLSDTLSGECKHSVILVYDVSRWGRFQNPDQAAHYEFLCTEAGVRVEYCAEAFSNDSTPVGALIKHIKRAMAAEYSRELSSKVHQAQTGLKRLGFWMGSSPGFGFRREAVASAGQPLGQLVAGQHNPYPLAHTRLALGPPEEVETVRRAFSLYVRKGASFGSVATQLNEEGRPSLKSQPWTKCRVRNVISDRRYMGEVILHKVKCNLGKREPVEEFQWETIRGYVPSIVEKRLFDRAQEVRLRRARNPTEADVLKDLLRVYRLHGNISQYTLRRHGRWSPLVYSSRLGSTDEMYKRCGSSAPNSHRLKNLEKARLALKGRGIWMSEATLLARVRELLQCSGYLTARLIDASPITPSMRTYHLRFGSLAEVYQLVGYRPRSNWQAGAIRRLTNDSAGDDSLLSLRRKRIIESSQY